MVSGLHENLEDQSAGRPELSDVTVFNLRRPLVAVACLVLAVALAGCASPTAGQASRATNPSNSATASAANGDVPKVANPKNLKAIGDPCQLLTSQQLQELGASDPHMDKSLWGEQTCYWINDNLRVLLAPDTVQGHGLAVVWAKNKDKPESERTTVNGHPALRTDKLSMSCGLWVGVSDTQVLSVDVIVRRDVRPEYKDRCVFAEKVAGMVLSNLPAVN